MEGDDILSASFFFLIRLMIVPLEKQLNRQFNR